MRLLKAYKTLHVILTILVFIIISFYYHFYYYSLFTIIFKLTITIYRFSLPDRFTIYCQSYIRNT